MCANNCNNQLSHSRLSQMLWVYYRRLYFSSTCENRSNEYFVFFSLRTNTRICSQFSGVLNRCNVECMWDVLMEKTKWSNESLPYSHDCIHHDLNFMLFILRCVSWKKILLNSNIFIISFHNILPFVLFANINSHFQRQILQATLWMHPIQTLNICTIWFYFSFELLSQKSWREM